jgi:RHH-type proline utilization regulon transcriptional repressor/proline dehydrogenase/delta 1-pyrroline-5-carboxylate dehydrogenase
MGKSAFGPGIKAGGPNYVVPVMRTADLESVEVEGLELLEDQAPELTSLSALWQQLSIANTAAARRARQRLGSDGWTRLQAALLSYDEFAFQEIRATHDSLRLVGQDNIRRYQPLTHVRLRVSGEDSWLSIFARAAAVAAVGGRAVVSHAPGVQEQAMQDLAALTDEWAGDLEFIEESDEELAEAIRADQVERLRYAAGGLVPLVIRQAAAQQFVYVADTPISLFGRIELLWYVREQSLCIDYHRYGNLGFRAGESRRPVL